MAPLLTAMRHQLNKMNVDMCWPALAPAQGGCHGRRRRGQFAVWTDAGVLPSRSRDGGQVWEWDWFVKTFFLPQHKSLYPSGHWLFSAKDSWAWPEWKAKSTCCNLQRKNPYFQPESSSFGQTVFEFYDVLKSSFEINVLYLSFESHSFLLNYIELNYIPTKNKPVLHFYH